MKTEILSKKGLEIYHEEIKNYIDDKCVELTQAEYDELDDTKLTNGVNYFITDGEGGGGGSINTSTILDTKAEIEANTEENKIAGALGVKELADDKLSLSGGTMTGNIIIAPDGSAYVQVKTEVLGTESENGTGVLSLGNNIGSGSAGNAKGVLRVYNTGSNYATIVDHTGATTNRTLTLPRVTGQIPVVSVSGTTLNINF